MGKRNIIKLTESELKMVISESVKRILKEEFEGERKLWRGVPGAYLTDDGYVEYEGHMIDVDDLEEVSREWLIYEYEDMMDRRWFDSTDIFDEFDTDSFQACIDAYCDEVFR